MQPTNEPATRLADLVGGDPADIPAADMARGQGGEHAADVQTILPTVEPSADPAGGVVFIPSASNPANIPSPAAVDVERVRLAVAGETAAMHERFTAGLIGGHGGGV